MENENKPAFPSKRIEIKESGHAMLDDVKVEVLDLGITKLELFAKDLLCSFYSGRGSAISDSDEDLKQDSILAVKMAKSLLKQLEEDGKK